MSDVTAEELMAITASRLLTDHTVVFAGVGMPLLASAVARRRHAPHLTIVLDGNINTSVIGTMEQPKVRLPGSGGANDIISLCHEVLIVTRHEPRRFAERVDFITSPGYLSGGDSRARAGLATGRLGAVVTDLAVCDFEPSSRRMRLAALQPGVSVTQVRERTGFDLLVSGELTELTPPFAEEIAIYRELRDGPVRVGI